MEVAVGTMETLQFGLKVCDGLLTYLRRWDAYPGDIKKTHDSVEELNKILVLLQGSLRKGVQDSKIVDQLKSNIDSCKGALDELEHKAKKLKTHPEPHGFRQQAKAQLQRAEYPFKANELNTLKNSVTETYEKLTFTMSLLTFDVVAGGWEKLDQMSKKMEHAIDKKIEKWLSPPNPWFNHDEARKKHAPRTGSWLLQSDQYQEWKSSNIPHIWLNGKAGCGKTVLCSTVIEDIRQTCETAAKTGFAFFYFSFSDAKKQSYNDFLSSLVSQLCWKEPGYSLLRRAYDKPNATRPSLELLENALVSSVKEYDRVFVFIDALDECPEEEKGKDLRNILLEGLGRLTQAAPALKLFTTSRELAQIKESMVQLGCKVVSLDTPLANADIHTYVAREIANNRRLSAFNEETKQIIQETFALKADGMFRWAFCQLQRLKTLKSSKPTYVEEILQSLPMSLDETYERMLDNIDELVRGEALTALRWLAFAKRPITLEEMAEACKIDTTGDGNFQDQRGGLEDVLRILEGLVIADGVSTDSVLYHLHDLDCSDVDVELDESNDDADESNHASDATSTGHISRQIDGDVLINDSPIFDMRHTLVRLAHFSVKEYLVSNRIHGSKAAWAALDEEQSHHHLAQSCLIYLLHFCEKSIEPISHSDFTTFPLLKYVIQSWIYHSLRQRSDDVSCQLRFVESSSAMRKWHEISRYREQMAYDIRLPKSRVPSGLYFACSNDLLSLATELVARERDVDTRGKCLGDALYIASSRGHERIVEMLIANGGDVNSEGTEYGNALQAALATSNKRIAEMLIAGGADVNAKGGFRGNALQMASSKGYEKIVEMLIDNGAEVNAEWGCYGNALRTASIRGHARIVEILINNGANVNSQGGPYDNALVAASYWGQQSAVRMLIDHGADIDAQGGECGSALHAASAGCLEDLERVIAQRGDNEIGLQAPSAEARKSIVKMLIDSGANINAPGGGFGNALQAASYAGRESIVGMLIANGANVNASGGHYRNALRAARHRGHEKVAEMLIEGGPKNEGKAILCR